MEELPEYQICSKCGKRSTPYMDRCWNCGQPFYVETSSEVAHIHTETEKAGENKEHEPEKISPCTLEKMGFTDKMFAYSLLFRGEMVLEFCGCERCRDIFRETLAFFREADPDNEDIMNEAKNTDIKGIILDISEFGL
ncbi:hypothetical protein J2128_001807 [Methanomicrobium sp. W14]|uniref:hypothetical protein n=1 Tax=Methanomicrobium sp. W14 TaxID=2817839 RepID=UPI001AE458E2|nr:hypothetical protein [Methanomicrobium sp. W14]MBP2133853.1 hypothetical protein [Methanomicrobium sp. W14]